MAVSKDLLEVYLDGVAVVIFKKVTDGQSRIMRCTQNLAIIPAIHHPTGTDRQLNPNVTRVFDIDKQEWRSFYRSSILSIQRVKVKADEVNNRRRR
jgi:hypothetical protein